MLWLALQLPRLGLEVWDPGHGGHTDPEGEQAACATVLLEDNRVVLCNPEAAAAGILPGCTLATAHSITADLDHFHRDEEKESVRLEFLAETLYRFSGQVSLAPPDGIVLEVGSSLALFGDATELAGEAQTFCEELGHRVQWQLAATPLAALVMARAGARRLESVPLHCAEIPDAGRNVERFANMGMHTLAPLLELPEVELGQRFGPDLVDYLDRLTGRAPDPRQCIEPSPRFDQALHLLEPVKDKDTLLAQPGGAAPMERLLNDLSHWLVAHQLGAEQLVWSFSTHTEAERVVLPLRFARTQQSREAFMNIVRLRLEQVELPEEILNVRLTAARLTPWLSGNRNLFKLLSNEGGESDSSELIDQLRARLGDRACSGIVVHDRHAPESAWAAARPDVKPARKANLARGVGPSQADPPPRPLWLFEPPHLTRRDRLTLLNGPERIQTAWWQQTIWRDYYVASLESGATCWAFVDARDQWYLHGYFG
jgi:protein ImuB